jgi:hypothetical protein
MKKKLGILLTSLTLVIVMLATLCGCSSYGGIKKAFENNGYKESESLGNFQSKVMECLNANSEEEIEQICTVHALSKGVSIAIIFEFSSTDQMKKTIESSDMLKGAIKDVQKSDLVNGNCVLFPLCAISTTITDIFKKA